MLGGEVLELQDGVGAGLVVAVAPDVGVVGFLSLLAQIVLCDECRAK